MPDPYQDLDDFLRRGRAALRKGPVALIMVEDEVEVASTVAHHARLGFESVVVFSPAPVDLPPDAAVPVHLVLDRVMAEGAVPRLVNRLIEAAPGIWFFCCYNAEYLFFPFCETRSVGEMLAFHAEERRDAMLAYVIDLYADDLTRFPDGVSRETAMFDGAGYYSLTRMGTDNRPKDRQLDMFGGLRWRFEEHIPQHRRRIDRIALFRAKPGLRIDGGYLFNDEEYNTYACPWHHNLTAAICSFRAAKALRTNPSSRFAVESFTWGESLRFDWTSRQLLDLGFIEPGQWF